MKIFYDFKSALSYSRSGEFYIFYRGVFFPFKWNYKGSDKTVIFLPGRTARDRKPIPVFQRSSYFDNINANVISSFDPTLFWSQSLSLGWYQGRGSLFYADLLGDLMTKLIAVFKTASEKTLLYGTSGGGIPGFNVAKRLPGCMLYVSNIQVDASRYHQKFFNQMMEISYSNRNSDEIIKECYDRISVINIDADFNLVYSQNRSDDFHYENHFKFYLSNSFRLKKVNAKFMLYDDPGTGHEPLSRDIELSVIDNLLHGKTLKGILPNSFEAQ